MRRPILLLALVVGLVAASAIAIAVRPTVLGLDLQGGVEVVLQGKPTEQAQVTEEAIDRSVEIIRDRVNAFGVAEPEIQTQGDDQIVVALPGAEDPEQVVDDLINPAQLIFIPFEANVVGPLDGSSLYEAATLAARTEPEEERGVPTLYAFDRQSKELLAGPEQDRLSLREAFPNDRIPPTAEVVTVPEGLFLAFEETERFQTRQSGTEQRWFVFQNNPGLTGQDVSSAQLPPRDAGHRRQPVDRDDGLHRRGRGQVPGPHPPARRGGEPQERSSSASRSSSTARSSPTRRSTTRSTRPGSTAATAPRSRATSARTRPRPSPPRSTPARCRSSWRSSARSRSRRPSGEESLNQALMAGIVGLVLVILFLIGYYRFLGVVAALGLIVYGILLYAIVVLVPITLTLPGIAGIILTIGVAADANVVIFERIREEARAGKTPRAAILAGYKKGLSAIIDANVVTFGTAAILFLFATAGVKGFAFTLLIGVLLSLFTAVVATRAVVNVLADTRFLRDDRYMGLTQREIRWKMDVVGKWKLWMAISFVPIAIGTVFIIANGLNLGLDFESGTRVEALLRAARHRGRRPPGHPGPRAARRKDPGDQRGDRRAHGRRLPDPDRDAPAGPRCRSCAGRSTPSTGSRTTSSSRSTPSGRCWASRSSATRSGRSCSASR